jgi:hypothetical protein
MPGLPWCPISRLVWPTCVVSEHFLTLLRQRSWRHCNLPCRSPSTIAENSRESLGAASRTIERANTLDAVPELAAALDAAAITAGHVDALTRATKGLDDAQRKQLVDTAEGLVGVAAVATVEQFSRRLRNERKTLLTNDGIDRLKQQRRAVSMRTWVDDDGMWNLRGRFDPLTGVKLAGRLDAAVETLCAEQTPDFCPSDPVERQAFLRAHAFARLVDGGSVPGGRTGRPEFVVVIDADAPGAMGPVAEWPIPVEIPVEIPERVLAERPAMPTQRWLASSSGTVSCCMRQER